MSLAVELGRPHWVVLHITLDILHILHSNRHSAVKRRHSSARRVVKVLPACSNLTPHGHDLFPLFLRRHLLQLVEVNRTGLRLVRLDCVLVGGHWLPRALNNIIASARFVGTNRGSLRLNLVLNIAGRGRRNWMLHLLLHGLSGATLRLSFRMFGALGRLRLFSRQLIYLNWLVLFFLIRTFLLLFSDVLFACNRLRSAFLRIFFLSLRLGLNLLILHGLIIVFLIFIGRVNCLFTRFGSFLGIE